VEAQDGVIQEAVLLDKRGMGRIRARVFVDCSADADVAADAGVPYSKGRSSDGKMMPATMFMRLGNVDDAKVEAHARAHPDERLFRSIVSKAREEGAWDLQRDFLSIYREPEPGEYRANISRLLNIDGTNPDDLTRAEIDGRRQCLFIFQFMRNNCPGLENARLLQIASHIGIRETRHIEGLYTLTAEDVLSGRRFKDAIGRGSPIRSTSMIPVAPVWSTWAWARSRTRLRACCFIQRSIRIHGKTPRPSTTSHSAVWFR